MKPRSLVEAPFVQVPARAAAFLEARLPLTELRQRVRGQDPLIDDVLLALRVLAVSYSNERGASGSGIGTAVAAPSEPASDSLTVNAVADLAGCTTRAVTRAAAEGRLRGVQDDSGRPWRFTPEDVALWLASRPVNSSGRAA